MSKCFGISSKIGNIVATIACAGLVAAVTLPDDAANWPAFVARLTLPPIAAQLAAQTELKSIKGNVLTLALPAAHKHLADKAYSDKLKAALDQATGRRWLLAFEVGAAAETSLAAQEKRARAERRCEENLRESRRAFAQGRDAPRRKRATLHTPRTRRQEPLRATARRRASSSLRATRRRRARRCARGPGAGAGIPAPRASRTSRPTD